VMRKAIRATDAIFRSLEGVLTERGVNMEDHEAL